MNIYFNIFDNSIVIGKAASKKEPGYFYKMDFPYSLDNLDNKKKAIIELLNKDEGKVLSGNAPHTLIISDETIANGVFDLPKLSRFKIDDVFQTRFKLCYPNYGEYFVKYSEYEKNDSGSLYFYEVTKKVHSNELINLLSKSSINIKGVTNFATSFIEKYANASDYPEANLIIGKEKSELIISKKGLTISINIVDYGLNLMVASGDYLDSAYFYDNTASRKYAGFVKNSIGSKDLVNDMNVMNSSAESGLKFSKPKELRILKDESLARYSSKNNARKFYSLICDIIEQYSRAPWFLPIKQVKVNSTEEMFELLNMHADDGNIELIKRDFELEDYIQGDIKPNSLYKKNVKDERRRIDWSKFFSFELGKKKKA